MKMDPESRVGLSKANKHQGWMGTAKSWEEARKDSPLQASFRRSTYWHRGFVFWAPELGHNKFLLF